MKTELSDEEIVKTFYPMASCSENAKSIAIAIGRAIISKDRAQRQSEPYLTIAYMAGLEYGKGRRQAGQEPVMFAFLHSDGTWNDASQTEHSVGMKPLFAAPQPAAQPSKDAEIAALKERISGWQCGAQTDAACMISQHAEIAALTRQNNAYKALTESLLQQMADIQAARDALNPAMAQAVQPQQKENHE